MLSNNDVLAVAKLSRLELTDAQIEKFSAQLSGVLEIFEKVKDVDVSAVSETSQVTGLVNVAREDNAFCDEDLRPCDTDELLNNTPLRDGNKIVVPKIIEDK